MQAVRELRYRRRRALKSPTHRLRLIEAKGAWPFLPDANIDVASSR